ncbi:TetR/AcrR family transcriptional regulator [Gordonia rhizosphera]|uniref:Putative TetR family transcriptional regulator n=1 Tax=Gordonia rhizosphera NBRC 16068 TaxID=1108045 RepID=K6VP45_9ACTN|nr:TetR/AcrR family transcriptional regulator [Gordonia rhizosphera]GAB88680.1 putative TetR family transcriptional regulator [Gordonia rhizosphera NBRC 16068]
MTLGAPTDFPEHSTRERLLDVAAHRFAEHGYRQTSLAAIAREVAITPSAVYFHFAGKEEVFLAAFDREAGRLGDAIIGREPQAVGDGYWNAVLNDVVKHLPEYPLVARVLGGAEPELMSRIVAGEFSTRLRATVAVSLRKGQEVGRVRMDIDRDRVALAVETIMLAFLVMTVQARGVGRDERVGAIGELMQLALSRR